VKRRTKAIGGAGASALVAVGAVAAVRAIERLDDDQRERWRRQVRIYRLTVRRGAHYAANRVRGIGADEERRARLDEQFTIRTAEDVAAELGNMKGAVMKLGQMVSFVADGLPPEARAALETLQQDVPPMAPSLAEQVVREELGAGPDELFLSWDPEPVAAASIGQVHRAVLPDGRLVAVKVQYPGIGAAIRGDLDNTEMLSMMFSAVAFRNLDVHALIDELRARMGDELDYRLEAACQREFADRYRDHPFIHVPDVVPERSAQRVLTTEWVDAMSWTEFEATAPDPLRQLAAEAIFRFAQGSVHRHRVFNGDPHPGNYRFHPDGRVSFFDFGLVKRWDGDEFERMSPILDHVLARDAVATVAAMEHAGFIKPGHGIAPDHVFDAVSAAYRAYLVDEFTFTTSYTTEALTNVMDVQGPYADVMRVLDMPPSFVLLDRVVWGVSALLGRLGGRNRWRGILDEYRHGAPPATPLGEQEASWRARRPADVARR
jgi:predicted unusual protein kinase regulating ubiquinone biosynthesis (AarF/ABC1/UbiB family)